MMTNKYGFFKLVRDNIVKILSKEVLVKSKKLSLTQYKKELKLKLIEEVEEFYVSQNRKEMLEELADLEEIIKAIKEANNISEKEISEIKAIKKAENGSFENREYIEYIEIEEKKEIEEKYAKNPDKYPLISRKETIFDQIIKGKVACYKIYEDSDFLAFLDIFPSSEGHTLLIPKISAKWVWDVKNYSIYMNTARKIVRHFQKVTKNELVLMKVIGTDVPYAHIHIIPTGTKLSQVKLTPEDAIKIVEKYKLE